MCVCSMLWLSVCLGHALSHGVTANWTLQFPQWGDTSCFPASVNAQDTGLLHIRWIFIDGRGMSPVISLDEAAGGAVLGNGGKPLYILDWPLSGRGHCADLCWMAGRPPLRDGYLVSNYMEQHWEKQWVPHLKNMLARVLWPHLQREALYVKNWCYICSRMENISVAKSGLLSQNNMCVLEAAKCFYIYK